MLPLPPIVPVAFAMLYAMMGALVGSLSGWLTALCCKRRPRLKVDAILGGIGFLLAFLISALLPWPTNTISYELAGGTKVTSTMNSYQHPERVAVAVAIIMPLLYELWSRKPRLDVPPSNANPR